ncbi:MAG: WG repeat-containing protein [Saprospiraceae bacterium]
MLLKISWPARDFLVISLFLCAGLAACRQDHSSGSEEESAYMADYESSVGKWGFMNKEGKVTIKPVFDDVGLFSEGLAAVNHKGLWGFINLKGKQIIKPVFRSAWAFHEKRARVLPFDHPAIFIDQHGKAMVAEDWSAEDDFSEGRARVKVGDAFGFIDSTGKIVIQPVYTRGWNFRNGVCVVEYHEKLGLIDLKGSYILNPEFDFIKIAGQQNIILCHKSDEAIAYDTEGKELANLPGCKMVDSDGHLISVRDKAGMYFFNLSKQTSIKPISYINIIYLGDYLWAGKTKEGYWLLDDQGHIVSSIAYNQINKFSDGLAAFSKGDFWGYIDGKGTERISDVFGLAWDYKEGYARVAFKDGIGFIDTQQKLAFYPPEGSIDLRDYAEGMAAVHFQ